MYFLIIPCLFSLLPILQLFHSCQRKVKRINAESQQSSRSQQNAVLSKNIQTSLATKLQELSGSFRKTQSKYLQSMSFIGGRDYTFSYAHPFRTPRSGSQKQTHVYIKCWWYEWRRWWWIRCGKREISSIFQACTPTLRKWWRKEKEEDLDLPQETQGMRSISATQTYCCVVSWRCFLVSLEASPSLPLPVLNPPQMSYSLLISLGLFWCADAGNGIKWTRNYWTGKGN